MTTESNHAGKDSLTRRDVAVGALKMMFVATALPLQAADTAASVDHGSYRAINIMNFIRAEEPRERTDLMEPVRRQMALIKAHNFPATWLLQYDALVEGPFVEFLKSEMPADHEVGVWFEMNRKICDDAGIAWRGNPDWEWDYHVPVAYAIGYTPEERRKLADTAAATFKRVFGHDLKSVASWNLDAVTVGHFSDHYGIDAFGNCRDQLATDGFTIWGAPIAGYYPNRLNAWSPAVEAKNQIASPIFRLLGQDPVYYYDNSISAPDTMETVWPTGRSETFNERFLDMIAHAPTQAFGYAQLGQENSFGWPSMSQAFPMQMEKLAKARSAGGLIVETMGETGRRFKRSFKSTPTQAQVMLQDPFGHTDVPQRTVWYQSKFLRANLHFRADQFYLRDLHVYNDRFVQPYLTEPVRQHGIEQRMLAVLDGYHWSDDAARGNRPGRRAMGRFVSISADGQETPLVMAGLPTVVDKGAELHTSVPLAGGGNFKAVFREKEIAFHVEGAPSGSRLAVVFEWAANRSALKDVSADRLSYSFRDFDYSVRIANGVALKTDQGVKIVSGPHGELRLHLAQLA
jgi:hypothetical protein